jgi:hypothetical protein
MEVKGHVNIVKNGLGVKSQNLEGLVGCKKMGLGEVGVGIEFWQKNWKKWWVWGF